MRAVICQEPHALALIDRPEPEPAPGEVVVRIRRVGLCGTDYHIFEGRHPFLSYPRIMGHELGAVIETAPPGSVFAEGQVVAINPYLACGTCIACRNGKPNACTRIRVLGVHIDGGMCERLALPESALVAATGLTIDEAAMVEFLAIGAHAVARAQPRAGQRMLVVGAGPIGIATALFARLDGVAVTLVDTRAARLDYAARALGFTDTEVADDGLTVRLQAATAGEMYELVCDATGSLPAMAASLGFVAHGGALVLVGVAPGDLVLPDPMLHARETTLLCSRNALAADFTRVIGAIRQRTIPVEALHTHSLDAAELPAQLPRLIEQADHVLKAIARF
ncbi:dehydrogenase [Sphingomonas metalli]|uniref:Dehydrogenase n=1 Tax=Sphingomonas metalli TaxID=1779358 RepID=A0A916WZA3_9SPHN|nr:zinc-binding alcohol dehydrogenase family protein [Sphingomonas metalli]GGB41635.1 dehydrogenase [Sphingomonas metalli]